ncbi:OmpH family outer membrane protein [Bacteroidales bacterium OttesenSCG-928-K03]|nr:OmpH family outer membrane protein [Odoribacter sp. OttesenSCG-928-L07]MDL2239024.1 OmpH family outer membrane protein [Bacteroidales bacterium OttesenSCG-928-L14]MDL2241064.1 OmpH family outer membrane protein [Bacteroidales bacterium OttesenSCG-928-K22]MDL2242138.1 OmpH family outer membrane protein [Bacteroidales bacterium OttesenSCG-928-K03]
MKKVLILAVAFVCCFSTVDLKAQKTNKFGHVDFAALFELMPEQEKIRKDYEEFYRTIEGQLVTMQQELQTKYTAYQQSQTGMSDIIKETKEREIVDLQTRIEEFQISGQKRLADKETELMQPLIDKARKAVEDVAKENGYTYIFNSTEGLLLYAEPSDDIMSLVKKKLGL